MNDLTFNGIADFRKNLKEAFDWVAKGGDVYIHRGAYTYRLVMEGFIIAGHDLVPPTKRVGYKNHDPRPFPRITTSPVLKPGEAYMVPHGRTNLVDLSGSARITKESTMGLPPINDLTYEPLED